MKTKLWKNTALHVFSNSIIFMILSIADLLVVAIFVKDPNQLGYYSTCLMISGIIWFVSESIQQFIKPQIAYLFENKNTSILQHLLNTTSLLQLIFCGSIFIIITLFLKFFLGHFGPQYLQAELTLFILSLASFIVSLSRTGITVLVYCGNEKQLIKINALTLVIVAVFGSILTHYYGMIGAALVYLSAVLIKSIWIVILVKYYYPGIKTCVFF
jgi:O-antigen/teichoic acid export membrane protein